MRALAILLLSTMLILPVSGRAGEAEDYLKAEAGRIVGEADRIKGQAERIRGEAQRLNGEAGVLRDKAGRIDAIWESARRAAPGRVADYEGRDRSQQRMRADARRLDGDANNLRREGARLDDEAMRLGKLAAQVDPQSYKEWLERFRNCCKSTDLNLLRAEIVRMARALQLNYEPSARR